MNGEMEEGACQVVRSFNGRIYFSPYANGLYEIRNTGVRKMKAPEGATVQFVGDLPHKQLILGTSRGLWILNQMEALSCLDSSYVLDMVPVSSGYYFAVKSRYFSSTIFFLDSALKKHIVWEGDGLITFHLTSDTLFVGLQEKHQLRLSYIKDMKLEALNTVSLNAEYGFLHSVYKSDSILIGVWNSDLSMDYRLQCRNKWSKTIHASDFQSFGRKSYISGVSPGIASIKYFGSNDSFSLLSSAMHDRFQYWDMDQTGSVFLPSKKMVIRAFSYIKQYPKLFNHEHSHSIFSLVEGPGKQVVAASNEKGVTAIINDRYQILNSLNVPVTNGSFRIKNRAILIPEPAIKKKFIVLNEDLNVSEIKMPEFVYFFYGFCSSKGQLYFGSNEQGLWTTDQNSFIRNQPTWKIIDSIQGDKLVNILTISEDTMKRIWFAHPRTGIGLFNPTDGKTSYFLTAKKDIAFGAMASLCDSNGTMWFATQPGGIAWYNAYKKNVQSSEIHWIHHPLLDDAPRITALSISRNHLIIAAYDKVLALDLKAFYSGRLNIKYLTQQEANLTSFTEQNTMITTHDSAIWLATNDNLFRWDFNYWLKLPKARINLISVLRSGSFSDTIVSGKSYSLSPLQNSFSISLEYYQHDLLPRYIRTALQYEMENIHWNKTSTETNFSFVNLKPGSYTFRVQVMELDGSLSEYYYVLHVNELWFKKWWVWLPIGFLFSGIIWYVMKQKSEKRMALLALNLERETQRAEINRLRTLKEQEMARLKLKSIANQIRPHFILNALNTIGASLPLKSKAERLLSLLSGNMNKLFDQSVNEKNTQTLESEWAQCIDTIEMNKIMYLPELKIKTALQLDRYKNLIVPIGLLHIPIENALLHGLRNKLKGTYELSILSHVSENYLTIEILDNGIGIIASQLQSNARKHGSGLKNIWEALEIYNSLNKEQLTLKIDERTGSGTRVVIQIPFRFSYEI